MSDHADGPLRVRTKDGELVVRAADDQLVGRAALWPGLRPVGGGGVRAFEVGLGDRDRQAVGVLIGCGYYDDAGEASKVFPLFRLVLPGILAEFLKHSFRGVLLPAVCLQRFGPGSARLGYALFGRSEQHKAVGFDWGSPLSTYESALGDGGTSLMMTFVACIGAGWRLMGFEKGPPIDGFDLTDWAGCGSVALDLMVVDATLVCIGEEMLEGDPIAAALVRAGRRELVRLPLSVATRA